MIHYLRLLRAQNLLIVGLTLYAMRWLVIEPIVRLYGFELQFSELDFAALALATLAITGGGYAINDYFDTKLDLMNRPEEVVVGKHVSRRATMALHIGLNVAGVVLGTYAGYRSGVPQLSFIFLMVAGLLWFYSTTFKRQFFLGNFLVALVTALVPLLPVMFELPLLNQRYGEILIHFSTNLNVLFFWMLGFSFFAFLTTLIREIVKDIEDFEGDRSFGRNTLPVVLGTFYTKIVALGLLALAIGSLAFIYTRFLRVDGEQLADNLTYYYFLLALAMPMVALSIFLARAKAKEEFHFAANMLKVVMLLGLAFSLVVYYIYGHLFWQES